jgi:hypothetical protein
MNGLFPGEHVTMRKGMDYSSKLANAKEDYYLLSHLPLYRAY